MKTEKQLVFFSMAFFSLFAMTLQSCRVHVRGRGPVVHSRPAPRRTVVVTPVHRPVVHTPSVVIIRTAPPVRRPVYVKPRRPARGHYAWYPGRYHWSGGQYVWQNGYWKSAPRSGAVWVAGYWTTQGGGHVWVSGRWR